MHYFTKLSLKYSLLVALAIPAYSLTVTIPVPTMVSSTLSGISSYMSQYVPTTVREALETSGELSALSTAATELNTAYEGGNTLTIIAALKSFLNALSNYNTALSAAKRKTEFEEGVRIAGEPKATIIQEGEFGEWVYVYSMDEVAQQLAAEADRLEEELRAETLLDE